MSLGTIVILLLVGLAIGVISGMVGIGGGVLVIPVLMFLFGFTQAQANGTSLAMLLPPIGIFAVMAYWRSGNVRLDFALVLAVGFAIGAYAGARVVNGGWINPTGLRVIFAMLLLYIAGRILFRPGGRAGAALETCLLMASFGVTYVVMRLLGRKWKSVPPSWATVYQSKQKEPFENDFEI